MSAYQVRNNTKNTLPVQTKTGFRRLKGGEVATLDLVRVNSERMRALQQGAQLTIVPAVNKDGRTSPALPKLHLGAGKRYGAMPGAQTAPSAAPSGVAATAGVKQLSVAFTAPAGASSVQYRVSGADNTTYGSWSTASNPQVITGLTTGATYSVQVRGVNGTGPGPAATATGTPT